MSIDPPDRLDRTRFEPIEADLVLLHAPAFFDFRDREDILFPYLSTSGDVPITPLYDYFPLGFKTLQGYLGQRGWSVRIVNLASTLLRHPAADVDRLLGSIAARVVGIDLHWMVHVQGSLAVARRLSEVLPGTPVLLGGISSTYYADELIGYPFVDLVMKGYDTHQPVARLLEELAGKGRLERVPNLVWKDEAGRVRANAFDHKPSTFSCAVDWSSLPQGAPGGIPILEVISTQNAGCAFDCNWCGGSRQAFRRVMGRHDSISRKAEVEVERELESMARLADRDRYHLYSVGSYNETGARLERQIDHVGQLGIKSVSYEQFHLTPLPVLERMARANRRTTITLSPESHDPVVGRLAGRGVYTMAEMEDWIERALGVGIFQIDIWFFIGMQGQDPASVRATVDYCAGLLARFRGRNVNPLICPMIPFLDPASTFFEDPGSHGYRIFHRTVEEHRRAMEQVSLVKRINYETRWLSRRQLVTHGYEAVRRLTVARGEHGALPGGLAASVCRRIDDSLEFLLHVDDLDDIADPETRRRELAAVGPEIGRRNAEIFGGSVANQAFPIERQIGGRWFDEIPRPIEESTTTG